MQLDCPFVSSSAPRPKSSDPEKQLADLTRDPKNKAILFGLAFKAKPSTGLFSDTI
jgi:hypothetical protein